MADLVITAADVLRSSGQVEDVTWGETITQGMSVYRKASDSKWYKAQCDGTAEESGYGTRVGVALSSGAAGQPGRVQLTGLVDPGATLTEGVVYCVSDAAGGIAPITDIVTSTWYMTVLGVAQSASLLMLKPIASGGQVP